MVMAMVVVECCCFFISLLCCDCRLTKPFRIYSKVLQPLEMLDKNPTPWVKGALTIATTKWMRPRSIIRYFSNIIFLLGKIEFVREQMRKKAFETLLSTVNEILWCQKYIVSLPSLFLWSTDSRTDIIVGITLSIAFIVLSLSQHSRYFRAVRFN